MSLPSRANKENFRLLDLSSDDGSDLQLEIIPSSRKKRISRRERNRIITPHSTDHNIATELQCAVRWAVRGTVILWLLMLTWICAALYDQVSMIHKDLIKVSTSSDGVGDALQVCHTAAKELRANTSDLSARLTRLEMEHEQLSKRVEQAVIELASVSEQLSAAPKLADTPRRLAELQRTVADFGSQINGFDEALSSAKKQAMAAGSGVEEVKSILHKLEAMTNETIANMTTKSDENIRLQVAALNGTFTAKYAALEGRIERILKTTTTAAPTATTPPSTTTITTSTTTTAAPQSLPDPPVKPSVLEGADLNKHK